MNKFTLPGKFLKVREKLQIFRWSLARLVFILYLVFSVGTLVGGFLTAPLATWYFFGDWRFWRYLSVGLKLLPHAWRLLKLMLRDYKTQLLIWLKALLCLTKKLESLIYL